MNFVEGVVAVSARYKFAMVPRDTPICIKKSLTSFDMSTTSKSSAKTTCFCFMHPGETIKGGSLAVRATTSDGQTLYTHLSCSGTDISLGRQRSLKTLTKYSLVRFQEHERQIGSFPLVEPDEFDEISQRDIVNCADLASNVVKLELGIVNTDGGPWTAIDDLGKNELDVDPTWTEDEFRKEWISAHTGYILKSPTVRAALGM